MYLVIYQETDFAIYWSNFAIPLLRSWSLLCGSSPNLCFVMCLPGHWVLLSPLLRDLNRFLQIKVFVLRSIFQQQLFLL